MTTSEPSTEFRDCIGTIDVAMNRMAVFSGEYGSSVLVRAGWTKCLNRIGYTPDLIVCKFREAQWNLPAENFLFAVVMRHLENSHQMYLWWRSFCGAMRPVDVARLETSDR